MTKENNVNNIVHSAQVKIMSRHKNYVRHHCNDPYQIIHVFLKRLTKFDQELVSGSKLTFSRMNNFGLTKTPFRRPRRYEIIDGLNVKI